MRRMRRLAALTGSERSLLLRALFIVGVARGALWILPVGAARRLVAAAARTPKDISVERFVWAVKGVSRRVPRATCLTQALAVQALLARAGHKSRVEIGVAKNSGLFEAHAWVVYGDRVVIGGPDVARYSRLTAWEL
jgi:hypothetical protein